ncbi:MAG: cobalamin-binding protein, partial [Thermodesulfobacteriota bacterium]
KDGIKILIGGAPVTEEFARNIGADGYAPDAASAVDKVKEVLKRV